MYLNSKVERKSSSSKTLRMGSASIEFRLRENKLFSMNRNRTSDTLLWMVSFWTVHRSGIRSNRSSWGCLHKTCRSTMSKSLRTHRKRGMSWTGLFTLITDHWSVCNRWMFLEVRWLILLNYRANQVFEKFSMKTNWFKLVWNSSRTAQ